MVNLMLNLFVNHIVENYPAIDYIAIKTKKGEEISLNWEESEYSWNDDQFEQLLEEKDISIPCEDSAEEKERHDGGNNARIYGAEYWRLEDGIHKILEQEDSDNTK